MLQTAEEPFNHCVVPTRANVPHASAAIERLKQRSKTFARILRATVRVKDQAYRRLSQAVSLLKGFHYQIGRHVCPNHAIRQCDENTNPSQQLDKASLRLFSGSSRLPPILDLV